MAVWQRPDPADWLLAALITTAAEIEVPFTPTAGFARIEALTWVLGVETILPILVGRLVRNRARLITRLRQQNLMLLEERESRALEATVEERLRLALSLQGVVAASVDAIIAEVAVAQADSGSAGLAAVQRVESMARAPLRGMRGTLLELPPPRVPWNRAPPSLAP